MMRIELLYVRDCPNHRPALEMARQVINDLGLATEVEQIEVLDQPQAERLRFLGSPTLLVDGVDIDPDAASRTDYGLSCRIYGASGVPPRGLIASALRNRRGTVQDV
jgi:hypothetical protein